MAITLVNSMVLYKDYVSAGNVFGASTNCTFTVNTSQMEVTTAASGSFIQILPTTTSFEISADGFITLDNVNYYTLLNLQKARTLVNVKFKIVNTAGNATIDANVYITSISINGPAEGAGTYSITLQGTGPYDYAQQ
jgi:predicted secreted protein